MKIFLAEDEPRLARNYRRNLEDEGHSVDVASDGEEALEIIMRSPDVYDVIVLDVLMPRKSGIAVCQEIRNMRIATPILLLTALDSTEDKVSGLDAGADDYLTKPFPFDELLARLRALVRRSSLTQVKGNPDRTILQVDDLVMDLLRHEVYRGDVLLQLTAREFALLEVLMRNAGRVLTRSQLIDRVWPDGTESGSNVLDTYIHYLRDKIDRSSSKKLIETIRGVGYTIRIPREDGAIP